MTTPPPSDPNSAELERRLELLEDPDTEQETILENLPWTDVLATVAGIAIMSVLLLMWAYPR